VGVEQSFDQGLGGANVLGPKQVRVFALLDALERQALQTREPGLVKGADMLLDVGGDVSVRQ
jgi:shikimate 5-dehydrogenase